MKWYQIITFIVIGSVGIFLVINMIVQSVIYEFFLTPEQREQADEMDLRIRACEAGINISPSLAKRTRSEKTDQRRRPRSQ